MPYVGQHRGESRPWRPAAHRIAGLAAVVLAGAGTLVALGASTAATTIAPDADAYVSAAKPATNYGTAKQLRADGSPIVRTYLRMSISGLSAPAASVVLRLHATSATAAGVSVAIGDSTSWGERTITFTNAPGFGGPVASSGAITSGSWVSLPVASALNSADNDNGTYTFVVTTPGSTAVSFSSREAGAANAPQLVVTPAATTSSTSTSSSTSTTSSTSVTSSALSTTASSSATSASSGTTSTDSSSSVASSTAQSSSSSTDATSTDATSTVSGAGSTTTAGTTSTATTDSGASTTTTSAGSTSGSGPCQGTTAPWTWNHVIVLVMENRSYNDVIGNAAAPYQTSLAHECATATAYHGVTHPSLPNYLSLTSGSTYGITDDNGPSSHPISAASIFSQVSDSGRQWRSYEESMPSNCDASSSGNYAVKHNPAAYYTGIATDCAAWDVPMGTTTSGAFASDLAAATLPAYSFVTPNLLDDTHNSDVATGDAWLQQWLPTIFASPAYQAGDTAVFVTYDEDDQSQDNTVPFIAIAPSVVPGTVATGTFDHNSLLRTVEEMLGLPTTLGAAATAASMRAALNV